MKDLDVRTDEELVEIAQASAEGDLRAFDLLVSRHQARVLANCRYLTRSPDDAEDLAQEVFIKGYFGLSRFEGRSQFKTWIQRIKVNHCLNHIRKWKDKHSVDVDDPAMQVNPELHHTRTPHDRTEQSEKREQIAEVLDSLPETLRLPLVMCDVDGLPYQEIADTLGIALSATKMRIKRGREEFRRRMNELTQPAAETTET